ncbi:MAG: UDP-N-acetylglucosamine 1-carboxyvinyltransferase [Thermotogaceae bacterium]|nr:UDP-N-acetylglucosamine 1-carboxyvinyltransferase [Thermotogaceae bacterium]
MGYFRVNGPVRLAGKVKVSGSKNASLPIIAASLISLDEVVLKNVPVLLDIRTMIDILEAINFDVEFLNGIVHIKPDFNDVNTNVPYELVRKMRASFNVLGPLAARYGKARVALPGGCSIGVRPVNFHIDGLERLGFEVNIEHGFVDAKLIKPSSAKIILPKPSVGATEHLMTTAAALEGIEVIIENAAMEPEIVDLQEFLKKLGVEIEGAGTGRIMVKGGVKNKKVTHEVIPDRIEAGTYVIAIAATGGEGVVENLNSEHLNSLWEVLEKIGVILKVEKDKVYVKMEGRPKPVDINVSPYPGFPTDLQPQIMTFLTVANGTSYIKENVFQTRFLHVDELKRMGADIEITDGTAIIKGVEGLSGAPVNGTDLRATAALLIAAFIANGQSEIHHVEHIFRGYENVCEKFRKLGGNIEYIGVKEYIE